MGSQNRATIYLRRERRLEVSGYRASFNYVFKVQGYQIETVRVGITEGWHDAIPSLGKALIDDEIIAIAKEFLEGELARGWVPSPGKNSLEIPHGVMEYRLSNGSFPS